uniref:Uncharacterized protein n=1 Tax=Timema poppense TaxID=170557 RepID=A0A7R9CJX1_TIMPO|nr:unnamed protein product [Timema poppensis]
MIKLTGRSQNSWKHLDVRASSRIIQKTTQKIKCSTAPDLKNSSKVKKNDIPSKDTTCPKTTQAAKGKENRNISLKCTSSKIGTAKHKYVERWLHANDFSDSTSDIEPNDRKPPPSTSKSESQNYTSLDSQDEKDDSDLASTKQILNELYGREWHGLDELELKSDSRKIKESKAWCIQIPQPWFPSYSFFKGMQVHLIKTHTIPVVKSWVNSGVPKLCIATPWGIFYQTEIKCDFYSTQLIK